MTRFERPGAERTPVIIASRRAAPTAAILAALAVAAPLCAVAQGRAQGGAQVGAQVGVQGSMPGAGRAPAAAGQPNLKRLPADRDGLTFRGEGESRSFAVFMTRQEADKVGELRLALFNAVSVLPERSGLRVAVNGRLLATVPVRSPGRTSPVSIRIPPGVLVPGFNAVSIAATLAHRVDCSVKATYELWTSLDPAETGFILPAAASASGRSVADIGGEPLAADGTTHIHVRLPDHPDAGSVERASRFVSRLVAEAHILRPLVDVGPGPGAGPGLDVAFKGTGDGDADAVKVLLRRADLSLSRDPDGGRLTVLAGDGEGGGEPAADPVGDPAGLALLDRASGRRVGGDERISFDDLGLPDESFVGRHYLRSIPLRLPADFYPGSYDKARILLDGGYAGDLDAQGALVFRVNGVLVSTLKLRSGAPGRFQHETVELPLQFFHPGSNEVAIEGTLTSPADVACDPDTKPEAARLAISGSSEVEFPHLAHLGTMPQIAGALASRPASGPEGAGEVHDAYLLHDGPDAIGGALTIAANLAAGGERASSLRVHFAPPGVGDRPGIVLGGVGEIPLPLMRAVERLTRGREPSSPEGEALLPRPTAPTWRDRAESFFRQRGFFFAAAPDKVRRLAMDDRTLLVASVRPDAAAPRFAGVDLPRFTADGRQWLLFTARAPGVSSAGIERLVADGLWPRLNGEAVALDVDDGRFAALDAADPSYVVPESVRIADLRPIMGGLMSSNIALTASAAILLLALLGLTTHGLLRNDRRRPR